MHTLAENYKAISLIKPQSITATNTGTAVDIEQYEDDCLVVVDFGALGGTTETFVATAEVSSDGGSSYTTGATFTSTTGSTGDNTIAAQRVSLSGKNRLRGKITMSGSSASLVSMYALVEARIGGTSVNSATPA